MSYTGPILLTGDQIALLLNQPTNPPGVNDGQPGFGMVVTNATALAGPDVTYRLVATQINSGDTFFRNGQFWRLQVYTGTGDPTANNTPGDTINWATVPGYTQLSPRGDLVSGLGDGDDYIVFASSNGSWLIYDQGGGFTATPTTVLYTRDNEFIADSLVPDRQLQFIDAYTGYTPICFCAGTIIATPDGPVPIEDLVAGDLVLTRDRGAQPVRWIGRSVISMAKTVINPAILPVRISAGAMGHGLPLRDLWLSPQHRVMVRSKIVARMTGADEALVAVKHLCEAPGIAQEIVPRSVTYLHLRTDHHDMICAEGLWAETLLLGKQALRRMSAAARKELAAIFPDVVETADNAARVVITGRIGRTMADRHMRNAMALVDDQTV